MVIGFTVVIAVNHAVQPARESREYEPHALIFANFFFSPF
jgi:hypothetical protein